MSNLHVVVTDIVLFLVLTQIKLTNPPITQITRLTRILLGASLHMPL